GTLTLGESTEVPSTTESKPFYPNIRLDGSWFTLKPWFDIDRNVTESSTSYTYESPAITELVTETSNVERSTIKVVSKVGTWFTLPPLWYSQESQETESPNVDTTLEKSDNSSVSDDSQEITNTTLITTTDFASTTEKSSNIFGNSWLSFTPDWFPVQSSSTEGQTGVLTIEKVNSSSMPTEIPETTTETLSTLTDTTSTTTTEASRNIFGSSWFSFKPNWFDNSVTESQS
ncbi:hypothetical protein WA026_003456, partial [Henosepilachna vigintioctopunctata]